MRLERTVLLFRVRWVSMVSFCGPQGWGVLRARERAVSARAAARQRASYHRRGGSGLLLRASLPGEIFAASTGFRYRIQGD
jgi:hypothetical protein